MNNETKKIILAFAEVDDQADFFLRFQQAAYNKGLSMVYITGRYSVYKKLKDRCKYDNQAIFLTKRFIDKSISVPNLSEDLDIKSGENTKQEGEMIYRAIWGVYKSISKPVKYMFF